MIDLIAVFNECIHASRLMGICVWKSRLSQFCAGTVFIPIPAPRRMPANAWLPENHPAAPTCCRPVRFGLPTLLPECWLTRPLRPSRHHPLAFAEARHALLLLLFKFTRHPQKRSNIRFWSSRGSLVQQGALPGVGQERRPITCGLRIGQSVTGATPVAATHVEYVHLEIAVDPENPD